MDRFESHILPGLLILASLVIWVMALYRADRGARLCLGMYAGSYLITTAIGAYLIAFWQEECADSAWGLDLLPIREWNNATYWLLLFLPFLVVPFIVLFFQNVETGKLLTVRGSPGVSFVNPFVYFAVLTAVGGFCVWQLAINNYLANYNWYSFEGNFHLMIAKRTEIFSRLPGVFFGAIYTALPALSFVSVYQYFSTKRPIWILLFALSALLIIYLTLSVMLKGMLLVYFLLICIGIIELKRVPLVGVLIALLLLPVALTVLQLFFVADWRITDSMNLLIYRMAWSHVYYVNVYPDLDPFVGVDLRLDLLGLATSPNDPNNIFSKMYPSIKHLQGAVAAPAHTRGYAQGGLVFATITTVIIGLFISFVLRLRQRIRGPISFAFYIQCLCTLYYLNQASVMDMIFAGYGMFWLLGTLGPLAIWQFLFSPAGETERAVVQTTLRTPAPSPSLLLAPPQRRD